MEIGCRERYFVTDYPDVRRLSTGSERETAGLGTGVEVLTRVEIAALDQGDLAPGEVVAGPPVADRALDDPGPVVAAEEDRVARRTVVRRPRERGGTVGRRDHAC